MHEPEIRKRSVCPPGFPHLLLLLLPRWDAPKRPNFFNKPITIGGLKLIQTGRHYTRLPLEK